VPNVKLRPAQEGAVSRPLRRDISIWNEDSQFGSDDTVAIDHCPRPFRGVTLCATGAFDKPTLYKQAMELGAATTSAFTDRVTHLVAVEHGGAKYSCALERKIPILKPSWIMSCYQIWLRGDDVEPGHEIDSHRLPIFSGVVLCPSGINAITRRTQINKLLTEHGGVYLKNLERPVRVTHLLCSGDEETDKMRYAEKFNSKGEANVHLVWEEWFWDSLEFGGRFDEEKYQVRRPRPERKSLPEETAASSPPPSPPVPSDRPDEDQEEPEEELAAVKRLPEATLQLWGSLLGRRGYEISDGALIKSPSKGPKPLALPPPPSPLAERGKGSVISQFRRTNSFAPVRPEVASSSRPQPFRRTRTTSAMDMGVNSGSFMASAPAIRENHVNGESSKSTAAGTTGIFAGLKFTALGEAKSPSVRTAIEENGGRMMMGLEDEDVDYVIVRLVSGSKLYMKEADETLRGKYRTECWLERCVFQERVCPPEDHVTFLPLSIPVPVAEGDGVRLSFSGLDQAEATWITRLLRALGIKLEQFFSKKSTHLLCPSATGPKFDKAFEWGTPVVTVQWLEEIARTGAIPAATNFLVQTIDRTRKEDAMDVDIADPKGKGKAIDRRKGAWPIEESAIETAPTILLGKILTLLFLYCTKVNSFFPEQLGDDILNQASRIRPPSVSPRRNPLEVMPVFEVESILATSTQLHPTTPTRPKSRSEIFPFGKPNGLLSVGVSKPPSTPSRTHSAPVVHNTPHHHNSHPKSSAPVASTSNLIRRPTQREIERERRQTRIPSSRSPSPLKTQCHPAPQPLVRIPSESPTRIPREVAKALEDNITTLLGKRSSADDDAEPAPKNTRPGKRQRPQRATRPQSRQASDAQVQLDELPIPAYDDSVRPLEPYDDPPNVIAAGDEEHGIRVTYEDPKQQAETKRLLNLLNGGGNGGRGSLGTRKSARIASS
ncbi:hypothetical protein C0991_005081, partial [Blastosporella zonata]